MGTRPAIAWAGAVCVLAAVLSATATAATAPDGRRPKKLIATGWDMPDTARLRANLAEMEQRPFDGVVLAVDGAKPDGTTCRLRWMFCGEPWKFEWFAPAVADLQACRFQRFTENFILVNANPGNVDWFDDAGWREIADHWRIAARVAKEGGAKGLLFDPEPYAPPHAAFRYDAQPGCAKHTFDAYAAKARARGRQIMTAVAGEFPDITLFCYFMNSVCRQAMGHRHPNRILAAHGYGLLPAFVDGWLDAAPPTVTFVDGCESAYRYNSEREYLEAALAITGAGQELVSTENRAKYRAQVQVSFGVYLDAYWNPKESQWGVWYVDGLGGPRVERLRRNVQTALRVADEYVWIYGEKFRWWPTSNTGVREQAWPEALPGSEAALRWARDPLDFARRRIAEMKQAGTLASLLAGGDFAKAAGNGRPDGWAAWQAETSQGAFTWDGEAGAAAKGAARIAGVVDGCFSQSIEAEPGRRFAVRAVSRLRGGGEALLRVRWQTRDHRWTAEASDVLIFPEEPRGGWAEMFGTVETPEGVGRLVVLLLVRGQATDQDVAWFDDAAVYSLDGP